ncbi:MAG: hypothetical protein H6943_05055 [Zoogloeaceae bacterium]|nr:hypothetical protein [Zoogloeaceae bacterium]
MSKRAIFSVVFAGVFLILAYHFVWAADWTVRIFPDGQIRRAYLIASLNPMQTPDTMEFARAVEWHRRDISDSLVPRALLCLAGASLVAGIAAFLPGRLRKRDDKHVRGAVIDDERQLRRRIEKEGK